MEMKFVPKLCVESKDEETGVVTPPTMEGSITVAVMKYPERMRLKAKFATLQKEGQTTDQVLHDRIEMLAFLSEQVKGNITGVDLTVIATKETAKSVDDLYDKPAFEEALSDLIAAFVMGFRPNS